MQESEPLKENSYDQPSYLSGNDEPPSKKRNSAVTRTQALRNDCTTKINKFMNDDLPEIKGQVEKYKIELTGVLNHLAAQLKFTELARPMS